MKTWIEKETRLTEQRNLLCARGTSREESGAAYQAEQAKNNRRYNGLTKNRRRTFASFK